jgi:hypothetical protein
MNTAHAIRARPAPRWLEPKTLGGTVLLFALGYVVWQPLVQAFFHVIGRKPWPFTTPSEWARFVLAAGCIGVLAGVAWYHLTRMHAGWLRDWGESSVRMLALCTLLQARWFAPADAGWWIVLLVTSVLMGAMLAGVTRFFRTLMAP